MTFAVLATVGAGCGGGNDGGGAGSDPRGLLESAGFDGVESGELELSLSLNSSGNRESLRTRVIGTFIAAKDEEPLQLDMGVEAHGSLKGEEIDFDGGLSLLSDRAVVNFERETYEPDPAQFKLLRSGTEKAGQQAASGDVGACLGAAEEIELGRLINHLKKEGRQRETDGTSVMWVRGELDAAATVGPLVKAVEGTACGDQLRAAVPLLPSAVTAVANDLEGGTIKKSRVHFAVDDNEVLRDLLVNFTVEPKGSNQEVEVEFSFLLGRVNEMTQMPVPSPAKPLEDLNEKLGVNPLEELEAGGTGGLKGVLEAMAGASSGRGSS